MKRWFLWAVLGVGAGLAAPAADVSAPTHQVLVLAGAPGEDSFASGFRQAALAWKDACARAGARCDIIGEGAPAAGQAIDDREQLRRWLAERGDQSTAPIWFVYVGHGTFDGRTARLNLRGPDVAAEELKQWLTPLQKRTLIFIHGGSASAPFLPALAAPNRIVVTATRSGEEINYARFGERLAEAIASPKADVDQDGQTSLLEAFVFASRQVQVAYAEQGRMATEHALIDDNGDGRGTPGEWFKGTRLMKRPEDGSPADGLRAGQIVLSGTPEERALSAEQRRQRDELEKELAGLRERKEKMPEAEYWTELEKVLRKLAGVYGGR